MRTVSPHSWRGRILGLMNGGGLRFPTGCQQPPARDGPGNSRVRTPASASEGRQQVRFSLPVRTRCSSVPLFLRSAPSGVTPPPQTPAGTLPFQTNGRPLRCEARCCLFPKKQHARLLHKHK